MGHLHTPEKLNRAFLIGLTLNLGFVCVEFFYGKLVHSLALVADAGHNLSDVLGLLLAWGSVLLSGRRPTLGRTYGMRRASILAAFINAVILLIAIGAIAWEALHRFTQPQPVAANTVIGVASIGILINMGTALLFFAGRKTDLNVRAVFWHMATDAAVSLGVVIAAFVMRMTHWLWVDPIVSLAIMVVILISTWGLFRDSINLALDAVPEEIDPKGVADYLKRLPGCVEIHDLHIWGMSTTETALTAHLVFQDATVDNAFFTKVSTELHDTFGVDHTTLQIEPVNTENACGCRL